MYRYERKPLLFKGMVISMKIKIGESIRELRISSGFTQEKLAQALGVSGQAVSRWESSSGYPDMELVPSIANFFHVSIDELFGYDGERDVKIKEILKKTEEMIGLQKNMDTCVAMLREAAAEFPSEPEILTQLGFALFILGNQKNGIHGFTKDGSDYVYSDTEYHSQNEYWQEALRLFEKALALGLDSDGRMAVICVMVQLYGITGQYDKAEALVRKQDSVVICRECLLPVASEVEKRDRYLGEALLALVRQLKQIMEISVLGKLSLCRSMAGVEKLLSVIRLYEAIVDDGNCGFGHFDLRDLYLWCSILEARCGNLDNALKYFNIGFRHHQAYQSIRCTGTYHYTAPLVSKVTFPSENFPVVPENSWAGWMHAAPKNLTDAIKSDSRYAECFDETANRKDAAKTV